MNFPGGGGNKGGGGGMPPMKKGGGGGISLTSVLFIMFVVLGMGLVVGITWLISQPETINAWTEQKRAMAELRVASNQYYMMLPEILNKWTILIGGSVVGLSILTFVFAASLNATLHKLDKIVSHGLVYERQLPSGQKTTVRLFQEHPEPARGSLPAPNHRADRGPQLGGGGMPNFPSLPKREEGVPRREQLAQLGKGKDKGRGGGPIPDLPPSLGGGGPPKPSRENPLAGLDDLTGTF